jgi:hypothetical protein
MSILDILMDEATATSGLKDLQTAMKGNSGGSNNVWYRYRSVLGTGQTCTLRFLPASENNVSGQFWLPKKVIRLKFADPKTVGSEVNINIPVMQMYTGGKASDDPILGQVTRLYEEAQDLEKAGESEKAKQVRAVATYHYVKGECIAQGFVVSGPPEKESPPENPIRVFELNKQIVKIISSKIDPDNPDPLEFWPCHAVKGYDFIITKGLTGDGKFPSYINGSGFKSRSRMLSDDHQNAIRDHNIWNLEQFLPARPSDDEYALLTQIVEQSIAGNRVWDADWESGLKTVKIYRSKSATQSDDSSSDLQEQVRASLSRITGTGATSNATSTEDVMAALSRTNAATQADVEPETETVDSTEDGQQQSREVRSLVDKIRKNQSKPATA